MVYAYQAGYRPQQQQQQPQRQANGGSQQRQVPYMPNGQQQRYGGNGGNGGNGGGGMPPQGPNGSPPKQPKKKKRGLLSFLLILLLLAVIVVGSYGYIVYQDVNGQGDVFYQGVFVGGLHVGGMTAEQATVELANLEAQQLGQWYVQLQLDDKVQQITYQELDLALDLQDQLRSAWQVGREGSLMERQRVIRTLREEPYYTQGGINYSEAKLDKLLGDIKLGLDRDAVDASAEFQPQNEEPFIYTSEINGRTLETGAIKELITEHIYNMQPVTINLAEYLTEMPPAITVAKLKSEMQLIVTASTQINTSSTADRNENIKKGLSYFDGMRVMPNERVSFNKITGTRNQANGWFPALEIVYGEYVEDYGGGICQVSTTLYQAVLRAKLEIITREPHGLPPLYTDMGQDATVSNERTDFVFRNNSDMPIYIRARFVESGKSTRRCEISIYGKPIDAEHTYTLETRQLAHIPVPEPKYVDDRKQQYVTYRGEEYIEYKGREGYKVEVYRVKMKGGVEVDREKVSEDYYREKEPVIYVGVMSRD